MAVAFLIFVAIYPAEEVKEISIPFLAETELFIKITDTDSIRIKTSLPVVKTGRTITIGSGVQQEKIPGFSFQIEKEQRIEIQAPAGIKISAFLLSGEAGIELLSTRENKTEISMNAVSGDITVKGKNPRQEVDIEVSTVSGDISMYFAPSGKVKLSSVSGDITIIADPGVRVFGSYEVSTTSGDIYCTNLVAERVKLKSFSGDVMLGMDDTAKRCDECEYTISTFSGSIKVQVPSWVSVKETRYRLKIPGVPDISKLPQIKIPEEIEKSFRHERKRIKKNYLKNIPPILPWLFSPLGYNRVQGVFIGLSTAIGESEKRKCCVFGPPEKIYTAGRKLELGFSYGFSDKSWNYWALLEQSFVSYFGFEAGIFNCIATPDRWKIDDTENSVFSFLFRQDARNYYRTQGFYSALVFKIPGIERLSIGYENSHIEGVSKNTNWSLLPLQDSFFENPFSEKRKIQFLHLLSETGYRNFYLQVLFSNSKPFIPDGFLKVILKTGNTFEFSDTKFSLRFVFGYSPDSLYFPYDFRIGGIASLPGYSFNEFTGNSFWLLNLDYILEFNGFDIIIFSDAGAVDFKRPEIDAGVGLGIPWLNLSVRGVRPLQETEKMKVYVRVNRRF